MTLTTEQSSVRMTTLKRAVGIVAQLLDLIRVLE